MRVIICFDKAAHVLIGTSTDEFFNFCLIHPSVGNKINKTFILSICYYPLLHYFLLLSYILHPSLMVKLAEQAETTCLILEGEIFKMTLKIPKRENVKNLHVNFIVPLHSHFSTAIDKLKMLFER